MALAPLNCIREKIWGEKMVVDYTEYKLTKRDGTVEETEATGWVNRHWDYETVEATQYFTNGTFTKWSAVDNRRQLEIPSPVPLYDPETDGDYSQWLVSNNID